MPEHHLILLLIFLCNFQLSHERGIMSNASEILVFESADDSVLLQDSSGGSLKWRGDIVLGV
jgi:hypothetical protein